MNVEIHNITALDALTMSGLMFAAVINSLTPEGKEALKAYAEMLSDEAVEAVETAGEDISEYIHIVSNDSTWF